MYQDVGDGEREGEGGDAAKAVLTLKCVNEIHRASCMHL